MPTLTQRAEADLGVEFAVPAMTRVTRGLNIVVWLLVGNVAARFVWGALFGVLIVIALTDETRAGLPTWGDWLAVIGLYLALELFGWHATALMEPGRPIHKMITGRPTFGDLGGAPGPLFKLMLRSHGALRLTFRPEDQVFFDEDGDLDERVIEKAFRLKYEKAVSEGKIDSTELAWPAVWRDKILGRRIGSTTLGDTLSARPSIWALLVHRLTYQHRLVLPLVAVYSAAMTWLVARAAADVETADLLLLVQAGLLGSVFIAFIVYVNHVHMFSELVAYGPDEMMKTVREAIPGELRDEWEAHVEAYRYKSFHPISMEIGGRYVRAVGAYFTRLCMLCSLVNAVTFLCAGAVAALMALALSERSSGEAFTDFGRFALGLAACLGLTLLGLALGFALMQNLQRFTSLFIASVVLALVPPLLTLVFTGELPDKEVALVSSIVTGVLGAIGTAIAEALKRPPPGGAGPRPDP